MTTTTDTDALLAYAREHEPGLWKALTAPRTSYVDWKPSFEWDKTGRIPLPAAEQYVALEAWWLAKSSEAAICFYGTYVSVETDIEQPEAPRLYGEGSTLAGAVLVALQSKHENG